MSADGGLGKIDFLRRLGKAFEFDHIHKGFQLLEMHNQASFHCGFPQGYPLPRAVCCDMIGNDIGPRPVKTKEKGGNGDERNDHNLV